MSRQLTRDEEQRISGNRKPDGQRPRYFDAATAQYVEISRDFESLVLLIPIGFRARIGQYLTALTAVSNGSSPMDELRAAWLDERHADASDTASLYGPLVTAYEDIRTRLLEVATGFDDLVETQRILTDLSKTVGPIVDAYESYNFEKSVSNVLLSRANTTAGTSPVQTELNSFVQVFLQYP